jgi:PIN domain nuclease of toxin-antitoxin system
MKLLLDTHLLLWAAGEPERLSTVARRLIKDAGNELIFSAASFWEIAIKRGLGREDFQVDPRSLRRGLLDNHYSELLGCLAFIKIHSIASSSHRRWSKASRC